MPLNNTAPGAVVEHRPLRAGAHRSSQEEQSAGWRQNPAQHGQVVAELAGSHGLMLVERIPVPANNPSIVFRRREPAKSADL